MVVACEEQAEDARHALLRIHASRVAVLDSMGPVWLFQDAYLWDLGELKKSLS